MSSSVSQRLAFRGPLTKVLRSTNAAEEEAVQLLPGLNRIDFKKSQGIELSLSFLRINDLGLGAFASPANSMSFDDRAEPTIVLPMSGHAEFTVGNQTATLETNTRAVFIQAGARSTLLGVERSVVVGRLSMHRLATTMAIMLGHEQTSHSVKLSAMPVEIPLSLGTLSFDHVFRKIFSLLDAYGNYFDMLPKSGLDDVFYRAVILAMNPTLFAHENNARRIEPSFQKVDRVCQYIIANIDRTIALTELESVACLSRRALHNGFMKAYGVSPMNWVRQQRLDTARSLLENKYLGCSVTQVLYACGFTNPSLFAQYYRQRFGELPSDTLARIYGKRSV